LKSGNGVHSPYPKWEEMINMRRNIKNIKQKIKIKPDS